MALNKREHTLAVTGGVALGLFVVYWLVSTFYWDPRAALDDNIKKANKDFQTGQNKITTASKDEKIWPNLGIQDLKDDPDAGEIMGAIVSDAYTAAARNAGITFTGLFNLGLHSSSGRSDYMELRFNAQANTTTARLARFLYAVETNDNIPARIESFKVNAVKPGMDDLHMDLVISALIYNPKVPIPSTGPKTAPAGAATQAIAGRGPAAAPLDDAAMKKLTDQLIAKRAQERADAEAAAAKAATQPKKTPEEMEAELMQRRAEEEKAATQPKKTPEQLEAELIQRRADEDKAAAAKTQGVPK